MDTLKKFLKDTILGGFLFLVPILVVLAISAKFWVKMSEIGHKLADTVGLRSTLGLNPGPIVALLLIVLICFLSGLLLRVAFMKNIRNGLDMVLDKFIPGYEFYKITLEEKIRYRQTLITRTPVILTQDGIGQAGVITDELADGRKVIFIPAKPGTPEGQVFIVPENMLQRLPVDEMHLNKILQHHGKGLAALMT